MNRMRAIEFLQNNAGDCVSYRTRRDILEEDIHSGEMKALYKKVLKDEKVQQALKMHKFTGWLGGAFHAADGPEGLIRFLIEKGVEAKHPVIQSALMAIRLQGESFYQNGLGRVGVLLDDYHVGGIRTMKSCVFAYANAGKDDPIAAEQIRESLAAFQYVCALDQIESAYCLYKGKTAVFQNGVTWPSIYHLRLLAYTQSWRNEENYTMLANAVEKLIAFTPVPEMKLLHHNQIISPASIYMNHFAVDLKNLKSKDWMMWFHRMEMLSRLGIVSKVSHLQQQLNDLQEILDQDQNSLFTPKLSHYYFTNWTQYVGLALENDWKAENARICDLTFRSLLILKYANLL